MPGNPSSEQFYRLLEAFRLAPGRLGPAARTAGISPRTAKKVWERGVPWAPPPYSHRPLCEVIAEEHAAIRAQRAEAEEAQARAEGELEAARKAAQAKAALKDATAARAQEATMVQLARGSTSGLLVSLTSVAKGAAILGQRVQQSLEQLAASDGGMSAKEASEALKLINRLSTAVRQASEAAGRCIEMERVLAGEPTQRTAVDVTLSVPQGEQQARLQRAWAALESARARKVIDATTPLNTQLGTNPHLLTPHVGAEPAPRAASPQLSAPPGLDQAQPAVLTPVLSGVRNETHPAPRPPPQPLPPQLSTTAVLAPPPSPVQSTPALNTILGTNPHFPNAEVSKTGGSPPTKTHDLVRAYADPVGDAQALDGLAAQLMRPGEGQ